MARPTTQKSQAKPGQGINTGMEVIAENVSVAKSGLTDIAVFNVLGIERIMIQVVVTGQALDQFEIAARSTLRTGNDPATLYNLSTDFTSPKGLIVGASGDLTTQGAGTTGTVIMDVKGLAEITLRASSGNAAGSTVSTYVGGA